MTIKKYKKQTKDLVKASVGLGVGSSVLGAMGQGSIATSVITPATGMMGVMGTAMGAKAVMGVVQKGVKRQKRTKRRKLKKLY